MIHETIRLAKNIGKAVIRRPRGFDLYHDLSTVMTPKVVFDVGANVGQSARNYLASFPQAEVYSFEPVASTFGQLKAAIGSNARFHPVCMALGAVTGNAMMDTEHGPSEMFQLKEEGNEKVRVSTLDAFAAERGLEIIDFIKIDTEGHDFAVLEGAEQMLRSKQIRAVQVEASMNPDNTRHVPFERFKAHLEERGYRLFGIYDQVEEFFTNESHLRRTNPVFIAR